MAVLDTPSGTAWADASDERCFSASQDANYPPVMDDSPMRSAPPAEKSEQTTITADAMRELHLLNSDVQEIVRKLARSMAAARRGKQAGFRAVVGAEDVRHASEQIREVLEQLTEAQTDG